MTHQYRQDLDFRTMIESETWGKLDIEADQNSVTLRVSGSSVSMAHAEFDQVAELIQNYRKMREAGGLENVS